MPIDLRSDTVTRPTPAMRQAMFEAEVGDDVWGEDPGARRLEAKAAELLGKEAALFVPSGTMANQIALQLHCRPGQSVILAPGSHTVLYESGAGAALAGVQFDMAGEWGPFDVDAFRAAVHPDEYHFSPSRLVVLENTHNRSGGRVFPQSDVRAIAEAARAAGMAVHMDGARLWNAAAATGLTPADLAREADTVSACFSKGLGAPVGSVLVGPRDLIREARRVRKMLGGGMRQIGMLCAAAEYALDHHRERLIDDQRRARRLAEGLRELPGVEIDLDSVETNIVGFEVDGPAASFADGARKAGVWISPTSQTTLRAVTHLEIGDADIDAALDAFAGLCG